MDSSTHGRNATAPKPLSRDVIHLYIRRIDRMEKSGIKAEYLKCLEQKERDRINAYLVEFKKKEYLFGRGLMKTVLARYLSLPAGQIRFNPDKYGKPRLYGSDLPPEHASLNFNLSHSHNIIALAVARDHAIGVDVEYVDNSYDSFPDIAKSFFTQGERRYIFSQQKERQSRAFFQVWTLKEAYIKAVGHGLSIPLTSFDLPLFDLDQGMEGWKFYCFEELAPRYWVSLALCSPLPKKVVLL